MWDILLNALITAVSTAAAGEVASKLITGKWLHEHLYDWWREQSDQINAWVHENESIGITRVIGFVNRKLDNIIVNGNRLVKLRFYAEDKNQDKHYLAQTLELSEEEVAAQFPELRQKKKTMVMEMAYLDAAQETSTVQQQVPQKKKRRARTSIDESVLSAVHPNTLSSRHDLAKALLAQGKNAEAELENRAVLASRKRVLGAEHSDTLKTRNNLANSLNAQGKYDEAEGEHRAALASRERVLGVEHPDVFQSCHNLAFCLGAQGKLKEALEFAHRAEKGWIDTLGLEHKDSMDAKLLRERIERDYMAVVGDQFTAKPSQGVLVGDHYIIVGRLQRVARLRLRPRCDCLAQSFDRKK